MFIRLVSKKVKDVDYLASEHGACSNISDEGYILQIRPVTYTNISNDA